MYVHVPFYTGTGTGSGEFLESRLLSSKQSNK